MISKLVFTKVGFGFAIIPSKNLMQTYISQIFDKKKMVSLCDVTELSKIEPHENASHLLFIYVFTICCPKEIVVLFIFLTLIGFIKCGFFSPKILTLQKKLRQLSASNYWYRSNL